MKKFKKIVFSLSMILFYANSTYATTTGRYVASDNSASSGKILLLLVALGLVALVLFLGYRMDKNEAQEKRKEQIIKNNNDVDTDERHYHSKSYTQEPVKEVEEYVQNDEEYMRQYKKASEETAVLQPLSYNLEEVEDNSYEEMEEEFVATYEIHKEREIVENEVEDSDSTMVFDTTAIRDVETEEEAIIPTETVKKYTRKKVEKEVEAKPKTAKKTTTKKASSTKTTKSTTKKAATKTAKKESEEKPKAAKKTTTKKAASTKSKSTSKKAAPKTTKTAKEEVEAKPKVAKKTTTKKTASQKATKTTKKTATKK